MDSGDLERLYDATAERFWDPFRELKGRDKDLYPLIPKMGATALDYGFGSGSLLVALARNFDRVVGVELSQQVITRCRSRIEEAEPELLRRIDFVKTDGSTVPSLADSSVDVIICAAVVEHVVDPYRLLDSLRRIARPGATLILTTPNLAYIKHRVRLLAGDLPKTGTDESYERWRQSGWDGGHLHNFTQETLSLLLKDCGWIPDLWSGSGERWPWMRPLRCRFPNLFSGELIVRARAVSG